MFENWISIENAVDSFTSGQDTINSIILKICKSQLHIYSGTRGLGEYCCMATGRSKEKQEGKK